MTWCLASVSCKIPGITWDNHPQMSFPMKKVPLLSHTHQVLALVYHELCLDTNTQHQTDLEQIAGRLAICATGSYAQQDSSCAEWVSWLLCMPFWLEANYIFLRTSHFFWLSSSSGLPSSFRYHDLFISTAPDDGSTNTTARWKWNRIGQNDGCFIQQPPAETHSQLRHHLVHSDAANAATDNMTLDAQLNIVGKTGSSKNEKQHAIRCMCSRIEVHGCQLMISHPAGEQGALHDQLIAACNGKPPWLTKAFGRTVCEMEHSDVVSSEIIADQFGDNNPRQWTKQALTTSQDGAQLYMVEVIAESHM